MPAKKDVWISGNEAAEIMTISSGHPVSADYVRLLSNKGKIRAQPVNKREKKYHKGDVEAYHVRENNTDKPAS